MLGEKLRASRKARGLSLQEVSVEAGISAATLSRIETNKQTVELGLFISIARILGSDPRDMLVVGDEGSAGTLDPVVQRFASLEGSQRKELWSQLAADIRSRRVSERKAHMHSLAAQVEELLAHIDYLRAEIEAVRKRLRE